MSNFFISLIVAVGVGVWVYNKMVRRTGGSNQMGAWVVAGVAAVIALGVALWLLKMVSGL